MLSTLVIFFCLCGTEPLRSWAEDPTELVSRENSKGAQQSRGAGDHSGRSSPGHGGVNRAVLGGGLTIDTLPDNMTHVVDPGKYYTWQSFGPENKRTKEVWVDMSDARHGQVRVHGILSNSYQQAVKVALSFDFPFYGHNLRQITIATGGFIFTGDLTHRMLTTTQYIAPLMANFDPGHTKESTVQYLDNGEVFVVQWEKVRLAGKESEGAFTFQAALHKTGDITFSYKDIPLPLTVMNTPEHPVKTGLSDAFMVTTTPTQSTGPQRQTIYEYHRIDIDLSTITSSSAVEFTALATCLQHKNCESCVSSKQTSGCSWCNVLQRCSDGMDRHRQEWLDYACLEESEDTTCEVYTGDYSSLTPEMEDVTSPAKSVVCKHNDDATDSDGDAKTASSTTTHQWPNMGVIAGIAAALVLLLALVLVTVYISFNPSVASPFYLTHRRKSYWPSMKFQKQQSGYTEVEGSGRESFVEAPPC
ncbi:plexin domain-containing protein 1-like isoform X2 [Synchiropus splendidus]|uniref:plexin domain-containing protein 1-like isoform X2 n=1 Tax=Synchiropus splendidus TaxID=270530 RepID=UPI00237ECC59|nr:plexin domain-containing protein 1-like isoform X2 [Synchiropus splendidus]